MMQPDGSFKTVEVQGPANWDVWYASWKVYCNTLLGLQVTRDGGQKEAVVTGACLEEYLEAFRKLVHQYPEAWHLAVVAEDRCRSEQFARIRRRLIQEHSDGRAPDFKSWAPWVSVFSEAARDKVFWDENVRDPALAFVARSGKRGAPMPPSLEDLTEMSAEAGKRRRAGKKRGGARERNLPPQPPVEKKGAGKGRGKGGPHPRPRAGGDGHATTKAGLPICYAYNDANGCTEPCPRKFQHVCTYCFGAHSGKDCNKRRA